MNSFLRGLILAVSLSIVFVIGNVSIFAYKQTHKQIVMLLQSKGVAVDYDCEQFDKNPKLTYYDTKDIAKDIEIQTLIKSSSKGAIVLILMPECKYCMDEIKQIAAAKNKYPKITIIPIVATAAVEDAKRKLKDSLGEEVYAKVGFYYDNTRVVLQELLKDQERQAVPFYTIFSNKGEVIGKFVGKLPWVELHGLMNKAKFTPIQQKK